MAFFQNSVLNKHLNGQDAEAVKAAYQKFTAYFHNPAIQQNIRDAKEEQFQEGFLRELFVDILGYTLNPQPNFNLTTELKNEKGAKKADGAILKDGKALGVIELKGTDTKDLDKINVQAFNYKNNQTGCVYVITSNFEKLRFFIHHSVEHLEFNLFTLTETEFQLLWLCLRADNLLSGVPLKVKEESLLEEEKITKQLYKDYAAFRNDMWQNMVKNSRAKDKLLLFKKTQKLLDRYLFIFFAEDSGLLPPNSISRIVKRWEVLKQEDAYKPLYDIFKQYFGYIDTGRKGQKTVDDIFAYNGGLFHPDEVLDSIKLDDEILHPHVMKLTNYDFQSEVDVNILGHIFENSLNEIENITAELEGQEIDKSKSKRKKDGVFYTPKYITKYIVDNTVGKLCEEKKAELGIIDEEYAKGRRNRKKETIKSLGENLQVYRNWLLNITICDPACGSGAFLNQALEFLMEEHAYVDELQAQLFGASIVFQDVSNHILEKNIFGVDINEESVDIAKLSLWLRTAQRGRKLTTLNNNIKCGNSLIDDPSIAGEKAFNWQKEFPTVFEKGGFDAVIGNPPYLRVQGLKEHFEKESLYYEKRFQCATRRYDIYSLFIEKSIELINTKGKVSYILPHKFLVVEAGQGIRNFLAQNKAVESIIHFGEEMIFADASTYTCIITLTKNNEKLRFKKITSLELFNNHILDAIDYSNLDENNWNLTSVNINKIIDKINTGHKKVKDVFKLVGAGIDAGADDIFMLNGKISGGLFIGFSSRLGKEVKLEAKILKPLLKGEDVKRYARPSTSNYIFYPHYFDGNKTIPFEEEKLKLSFPMAYEYISQFKDEMIARKIRKKTNPKYWYSLHMSRDIKSFENEKIITPEISLGANMTLDASGLFHNTKVYYLVKQDEIMEDYKYFLGILNSSLMWFYLKSTGYVLRGGYFTFKTKFLEPFPLPQLKKINDQNSIIESVNQIIDNTTLFQNVQNQFIQLLQSKFSIEKLTKKLENWYELEFGDFLKELKKAKVQLSLSEEAEWMQYFNEQKQKAQTLKSEINRVDAEIDKMVYQLYGLTEEEIAIVEGSNS